MKWSGDVDLNDGTLQQSYEDYLSKLEFFAGLGIATRECSLKEDLVLFMNNCFVTRSSSFKVSIDKGPKL